MKKQVFYFAVGLFILPTLVYAQVIFPNRGGTGTTTTPTAGYVLVGQSNGTYAPQATNTLGITADQSITTSTTPTPGHIPYWSSVSSLGSIATGTLTESIAGIELNGTPTIIGPSILLLLTSGYTIPLTASTSQWATAYSWGNHATQGYLSTTSGNWSGTFDGLEGTSFLDRANHTGTQTASTISDFTATARGTISDTVDGLTYTTSTGVLSLDAGREITKTASSTNWNDFYNTPSNRITAGNHIDWTGNTIDVVTTGDWTGTVDGNNFVGGAIGAGDLLYGSSAGNISELNLGSSSTILVSNGSSPLWITGPAICLAITGSAELCDGSDAGSGGGISSLNGLSTTTQTFATGTANNITLNISSIGNTHTFTPGVASGYTVPANGDITNWNTAFGWGNHAIVGYLSTTSGNWLGTFDGQEGSYYLSRANHTGTQSSSTITGLGTLAGLNSIDISANTNLTAGDALTLTDDDLDFDGGATPQGELGGTWSSPTVDDSLAVTSWNLTTPTLTSFFGTPCTGNQFLQDIGDNGAFTCVSASNTAYLATSSPWTEGNLAYVTGQGSVGSVATGTLTETVTGLELNATRALVGGSAILALTSGYGIPLTASTTEWANFYATPSTRITAGANCSWTGNTFNCTGGGGGGSDTNWTFNTNRVYLATTTNSVVIGATATTTNSKLEVVGTTTATVLVATSSIYSSSTASSTIGNLMTNWLQVGVNWVRGLFGAGLSRTEDGNLSIVSRTDKRYNPQQITPTNHYSLDSGWSDWYANGTTSHDGTDFIDGTASMKIQTESDGSLTGMRLNITDVDMSNQTFGIWLKSDNWSGLAEANVLISTDGAFTSFYYLNAKTWLVSPANNEWIHLTFTLSDLIPSGSPNLATANDLIIRAIGNVGTTSTLWVDGLSTYKRTGASGGVVSITFDDANDSQFTTAEPYLDKYGYKGTFYIIPEEINTGGSMTQAQVENLHSQGHEVAMHGATNLSTFSLADLQTELNEIKAYQIRYGFSDNFSYPNGAYNDQIREEVSKRFSSSRNISFLKNNPGYIDPYYINAVSMSSSTATSTLTGMIDEAIANDEWLILNFHDIVTSATAETQLNTSKYQAVIDYLNTTGVTVMPVEQVLARTYESKKEEVLFSTTLGSTTPAFVSGTQIPIAKYVHESRQLTQYRCWVEGGTSKVFNVTDGTNDTETITCGASVTSDTSVGTNNTFTPGEKWYLETGTTTGSVNYVTFEALGFIK